MSLATQAAGNVAAQHASGRRPRTNAEAARYGVLRRLAPALKHDMVVNLQAVAMMAEVLSARLEKGSPTVAEFEASISKMNRLARDAVMTSLKVAAWISPSEEETVRLRDGVDECVALLRSSFNFRGCTLANEVPDVRVRGVARRAAPPGGGLAAVAGRRRRGAERPGADGRDLARLRRAHRPLHAPRGRGWPGRRRHRRPAGLPRASTGPTCRRWPSPKASSCSAPRTRS